MEKIFLFVVLFAVVESAHKHHPKFLFSSEEYHDPPVTTVVACNNDHQQKLHELIEKARCGAPKEVFVNLMPPTKHEQVIPSGVWIKRCVGVCDHDEVGTSCVATSTVIKSIPIRKTNVKTKKETCSTYLLEEHVSCGCCLQTAEDCGRPRVYNPRKCTCQCPNMEERKICFKQRNLNKRWNRSKCTCEDRRRRAQ